jgi:hypothetical protein
MAAETKKPAGLFAKEKAEDKKKVYNGDLINYL